MITWRRDLCAHLSGHKHWAAQTYVCTQTVRNRGWTYWIKGQEFLGHNEASMREVLIPWLMLHFHSRGHRDSSFLWARNPTSLRERGHHLNRWSEKPSHLASCSNMMGTPRKAPVPLLIRFITVLDAPCAFFSYYQLLLLVHYAANIKKNILWVLYMHMHINSTKHYKIIYMNARWIHILFIPWDR